MSLPAPEAGKVSRELPGNGLSPGLGGTGCSERLEGTEVRH